MFSSVQKIRMRLRGFDHRVLDRSIKDIIETTKRTGARVRGPIPLPRKISRFTVLRSPHIDKKARDQFERCIYTRFLDIECSAQTLEALTGLTLASEIEIEIKV
jgi:small subunit ribosomal protein S10